MPTIKLELENDIYMHLIRCGVNIEEEFKKFLLQKRSSDTKDEEATKVKSKKVSSKTYWDALDKEIENIKEINSEIFKK